MLSLRRLSARFRVVVEAYSKKIFDSRVFISPALELCPVNGLPPSAENSSHNGLSDIINGIWLMAAPKSKVTNMRKKRKHLRYIPKAKQWITCNKCGEPKLPHRICKKHLDICAMRKEEWEEKKKSLRAQQNTD